jgi:hypothetical protein
LAKELTPQPDDDDKARLREKEVSRQRLLSISRGLGQILTDIRAQGWRVAVHNDYRLRGQDWTFWLFTKEHFAVKGEGINDVEALLEVERQIAWLKSTETFIKLALKESNLPS